MRFIFEFLPNGSKKILCKNISCPLGNIFVYLLLVLFIAMWALEKLDTHNIY